MAKSDTQLRKLVRETPLAELVDVGVLQRMQDRFGEVTGVSVVIRDLQGRPVTRPSCQNAFCSLMAGSQYGETLLPREQPPGRGARRRRAPRGEVRLPRRPLAVRRAHRGRERLRRDDRHRRPAGRPGLAGAHRPTGAPQRHPGEKTPLGAQHRPALVGRGDDARDHAARLDHERRRGPLLPGRGAARQAARNQHALRGQQAPRRNARPEPSCSSSSPRAPPRRPAPRAARSACSTRRASGSSSSRSTTSASATSTKGRCWWSAARLTAPR